MSIEITDVYLRDGLQDEPVVVPTETKLHIAGLLVDAGLRRIEAGSFVNPKKVPQMADAPELFARLPRRGDVVYAGLALNARGVERAAAAGVGEVQLVVSASEAHSSANAGRTVDEAAANLAEVVERFPGTTFVGGIATAFRCPYEGRIDPTRVARLAWYFRQLGITSIGLADTLGTTPTNEVLEALCAVRDAEPGVEYSLHLHDAIGQALDTAVAAAEEGVARFDAALAGYGGCPFAPGAHGNLATERLVDHLERHGFGTGVDSLVLAEAAHAAQRAVELGAPVHDRARTKEQV